MDDHNAELATLAGGCFWCLEAVYQQVHGVAQVVSGYSGGHVDQPTYQQVCSETTGHAEAVQITFDSQMILYREILDIFFTIHDPTTLNRQGYDVGSSYRSVIFYHTPEQQIAAEEAIAELNEAHTWSGLIVTEVTPLATFYPAEDYHQQFYLKDKYQPYCQAVISPKLAKFRKGHVEKLKPGVSI
ncbi:MAG: peptide-methionine (S)-S-oxide reductase MsrA [Chloroflexi bacterium]|nr:peptide-methionine (S)-S-oxide reductase MsrA [Chloroflexota bacterium]